MGLKDIVKRLFSNPRDVAGTLGAGLGAQSQASATNRGQQFTGQLDMARLLSERDIMQAKLRADADNDFVNNTLAREKDGRAGREDAWRKLLSAQRVTNPDPGPGTSLTPYAVARRQPTHAETTGATALSEDVRNRLITGNPLPEVTRRGSGLTYDPLSTLDPRLLQAGAGERASGWLGATLSAYERLGNRSQPGSRQLTVDEAMRRAAEGY